MGKFIYETPTYVVVLAPDGSAVIDETGKYNVDTKGYNVVNRETSVVEHTTMMLAGAIFQCNHFTDTLAGLLAKPEDNVRSINVVDVDSDVILQ